jgi:hypothetical protein
VEFLLVLLAVFVVVAIVWLVKRGGDSRRTTAGDDRGVTRWRDRPHPTPPRRRPPR